MREAVRMGHAVSAQDPVGPTERPEAGGSLEAPESGPGAGATGPWGAGPVEAALGTASEHPAPTLLTRQGDGQEFNRL